MWTSRREELPKRRGLRLFLYWDARPASVADVLRCWQDDAEFRTMFSALLAGVPFAEFRWETPAVAADTVTRSFECVVLDASGLSPSPNPEASVEHFTKAEAGVSVFTNLSGDATLVVPSPIGDYSAYGHLAAFVRQGPEDQRHALWKSVGKAMTARVGVKPVWL